MTVGRRLGLDSTLYTMTALLQRGTNFLLLPLYTRFMTPGDYGILAVVTALNGFLAIFFTFALHGAMTRFYFEYRDRPDELRRFWGTVITFVAVVSFVGAGVLLACGSWLLGPVTGGVAFWPFVALGVVTVAFQPTFTMFLNVLQTRGESWRFTGYALANFALTLAIAVSLVVFARWGALGQLVATLVASVLFALLGLWRLRREFRWGIDRAHLWQALRYCLPQVPHSLGGQVLAATDRLLLNRLAGTSAAGLYNVGATFGMLVDLLGYSINRAYVPIAMEQLKSGSEESQRRLRELGLLIIAGILATAVGIGVAAQWLVQLMTAPGFHDAARVVPFAALAGAASGIYYVLVNVLFFDLSATRFLPLALVTAATVSVAGNLLLIPIFGVVGAAIAGLIAQIAATTVTALVGRRFDPIRWPYVRIVAAFGISATLALAGAHVVAAPGALALPTAAAAALVSCAATSWLFWGRPAHALRSAGRLLVALASRAERPA